MTHQANPGSRPWWSYVSLSVRGLIALVIVIAAALACIAIPANRQRNAVRRIEESGGKVWYNSDPAAPILVVNGRTRLPPAGWTARLASAITVSREWVASVVSRQPPDWLVASVGIDNFQNVVSVALTHRATDADLVEIARFPRVERVDIHGAPVSATGLARLRVLPRLETLIVVRTQLDEPALAIIGAMKSLRVLSLAGTELSDQSLSHLANLTSLEDLDLASTKVSDRGLAFLEKLTGLQALNLSRTAITDRGLVHIERLTGLRELALDRTGITDPGMKSLKGLTSLVELTLDRTNVGDAGLCQIDGLHQLATLSLGRTRVSDAAVLRLQLMRAAKPAAQATGGAAAIPASPTVTPNLLILR
jgi:hypothetical protein